MEETLQRTQRQERVTLHEPTSGWSLDDYRTQLDAYALGHGRGPQTITMHPATMKTLGLSDTFGDTSMERDAPVLVTSRDYDRATITLYY